MKKTIIVFLILAATGAGALGAAGVCFAGDNNVGNSPNPPTAENGGPNTQDNSDRNATSNNY